MAIQKWKCSCECGNITIVAASKLKNVNTRSCGCITTLDDLTGNRYGRLEVLYRHFENTKLGFPIWACSCSCGNKTLVRDQSPKKRSYQELRLFSPRDSYTHKHIPWKDLFGRVPYLERNKDAML